MPKKIFLKEEIEYRLSAYVCCTGFVIISYWYKNHHAKFKIDPPYDIRIPLKPKLRVVYRVALERYNEDKKRGVILLSRGST